MDAEYLLLGGCNGCSISMDVAMVASIYLHVADAFMKLYAVCLLYT